MRTVTSFAHACAVERPSRDVPGTSYVEAFDSVREAVDAMVDKVLVGGSLDSFQTVIEFLSPGAQDVTDDVLGMVEERVSDADEQARHDAGTRRDWEGSMSVLDTCDLLRQAARGGRLRSCRAMRGVR